MGAGVAAAAPTGITPDLLARAEAPAPYPTFASVPPIPKDLRPVGDWRAAVVGVQEDGARLERYAASMPWSLTDSEAWAARARTEATPPPPVTTSTDPETEALVAAMRARAMTPPRRR